MEICYYANAEVANYKRENVILDKIGKNCIKLNFLNISLENNRLF